jgi:hypothetical protein
LNPFQAPLDKFTYYVGNPFLKPSYTNDFELSYSIKHITASLSYGKATDNVNETIEIVKGIYYSRPGNLGSMEYKTALIEANFDPAKWLNVTFNGRAQNIHTVSDFYTGTLNTQGTCYFGRLALQAKPGKDWVIQASGGYQSSLKNAQFDIGSKHRFDASVSKKLSPAATVKFAMNDIFYNLANPGVINNLANTLANYTSKGDSRFGTLSLTWRFGKAIKDQRKHDANGAESEQNRVKN